MIRQILEQVLVWAALILVWTMGQVVYASEAAVPVIEYPEELMGYLSSGRVKWSWTTRFKETGGSVGYTVTGEGYISDYEGHRWYPVGGGYIQRGTVEVPAGGTASDSYWVSCGSGGIGGCFPFVGGYAVFWWEGEDENGNPIDLVEKVDLVWKERPVVSDIPDQTVKQGETFANIHLDDYVSDPDNADSEIVWTYEYDDSVNINISNARIATITVKDTGWTGFDNILFEATDPDGLCENDWVAFRIELMAQPTLTSFAINNGDPTTTSRTVVLNNTATNDPTHYVASENSNFSGAIWQLYSNAPSFTLSSGYGTKTVYLKVKNADGESNTRNDSIEYRVSLEHEMEPGWNLVSIPFQLPTNALETVLQSIADHYTVVYAYNATDGQWQSYFVGGPDFPGKLETLEDGRGYWIRMDDYAVLTLVGDAVADAPVPLKRGWNLVGYNSLTSRSVEEALSSIAGRYSALWSYDGESSGWRRYIVDGSEPPNNLETMEPMKGYWMNIIVDECEWTVP